MKKCICTYLKPDLSTKLSLPFFPEGIKAGYPSPAKDYRVYSIDLNISLAIDEYNDYYRIIENNDLSGYNIFEGDLAVVKGTTDLEADLILNCLVDGEDVIRKLKIDRRYNNHVRLITPDKRIPHIEVTPETDCICNGVVYYTVTSHVPVLTFINGIEPNTVDLNKKICI